MYTAYKHVNRLTTEAGTCWRRSNNLPQ